MGEFPDGQPTATTPPARIPRGGLTVAFPTTTFPWVPDGMTEAQYMAKDPEGYDALYNSLANVTPGALPPPPTNPKNVTVLEPGEPTYAFIRKTLDDPNFVGNKEVLRKMLPAETGSGMPEGMHFENPFANWTMPNWTMPAMPAMPTMPGKIDPTKALKKASVKTSRNKRLRILSSQKDETETLGQGTTSGKASRRRLLGAG